MSVYVLYAITHSTPRLLKGVRARCPIVFQLVALLDLTAVTVTAAKLGCLRATCVRQVKPHANSTQAPDRIKSYRSKIPRAKRWGSQHSIEINLQLRRSIAGIPSAPPYIHRIVELIEFLLSFHPPQSEAMGVQATMKEFVTEVVPDLRQVAGASHSLLPFSNIEGDAASSVWSLQWRRWEERRSRSEAEKIPRPKNSGCPCQNWCRSTVIGTKIKKENRGC